MINRREGFGEALLNFFFISWGELGELDEPSRWIPSALSAIPRSVDILNGEVGLSFSKAIALGSEVRANIPCPVNRMTVCGHEGDSTSV